MSKSPHDLPSTVSTVEELPDLDIPEGAGGLSLRHAVAVAAALVCVALAIVFALGGTPGPEIGETRTVRFVSEGSAHPPMLVPSRVERVVPGTSGIVDLLLPLVEAERIAAMPMTVHRYSMLGNTAPPADASRWPSSREEWKKLLGFKAFTAEQVLSYDPDLVIYAPWNISGTAARLRERGVLAVEMPEASSLERVVARIRYLGDIFEVEDRAEELIADMEARAAALYARERPSPAPRALAYGNSGARGTTRGPGTTVDEVLRLAGFVNAAAEAKLNAYPPISYSEIIAMDPEYIVVQGPNEHGGSSAADTLRSIDLLKGLRVVIEDNFIELPPRLWDSNSHEMLTAAEWLADELQRRREAR